MQSAGCLHLFALQVKAKSRFQGRSGVVLQSANCKLLTLVARTSEVCGLPSLVRATSESGNPISREFWYCFIHYPHCKLLTLVARTSAVCGLPSFVRATSESENPISRPFWYCFLKYSILQIFTLVVRTSEVYGLPSLVRATSESETRF